MGLQERLEKFKNPGKMGSDVKAINTPEDWRPRMDIDSVRGGYVVSNPMPSNQAQSLDEAELLAQFDLNPADWVVTSLRRGKWQKYDGEYLESIRLNISPAKSSSGAVSEKDIEKLIDEIKKWRPNKSIKRATGSSAFLIAPSDQQIGKKAGLGGTELSIDRILNLTEKSIARFEMYKKSGISLGTICLALPGDHVEGNVSQNGKLQGQAASDLGITEQVRVSTRLLLAQIKALAPLADKLIVPVVNGNHDESTRQVAADPADGWNTLIASTVQDICAENPELSNVEFRFPNYGHQTLAVDVAGTMIGIFHGHQASEAGILKYISGQAAGQTPLGMSDIWISGHYHHFKTLDIGDRFWVQAPTTDPGSDWYRDKSGMQSKPGLLTMIVGGSIDPREFIGVIPTN